MLTVNVSHHFFIAFVPLTQNGKNKEDRKKSGDSVQKLESFLGNRYTLSLCINMHVCVVYCGPFILTVEKKKTETAKIYVIIFIAEFLLSLVSLACAVHTVRRKEVAVYSYWADKLVLRTFPSYYKVVEYPNSKGKS